MANKGKAPNKQTVANQSAERLLIIMEYMSQNPMPIRLQDASRELKIPQSTLLRYFNILEKRKYMYQDKETLRYALTWKVCQFERVLKSNFGIRSAVGNLLSFLALRFDCGTSLAVSHDFNILYLDIVDSPGFSSIMLQQIGKHAPMHAIASGKVLLSSFSKSELLSYAKISGLVSLTENTISDYDELVQELDQVRSRGFATDDEECEKGIRCISVPVYDYTNQIIAGISVFNKTEIMTDTYIANDILPVMQSTANEISERLGYKTDF